MDLKKGKNSKNSIHTSEILERGEEMSIQMRRNNRQFGTMVAFLGVELYMLNQHFRCEVPLTTL